MDSTGSCNLQRPEAHWQSNLHWLSPADDTAHDDYLQALSIRVLELGRIGCLSRYIYRSVAVHKGFYAL